MMKAIIITLGVILGVCLFAFAKKIRLGGSTGYKDKHPPGKN